MGISTAKRSLPGAVYLYLFYSPQIGRNNKLRVTPDINTFCLEVADVPLMFEIVGRAGNIIIHLLSI